MDKLIMDQALIWQNVLGKISDEYPTSQVKMWFSNLNLLTIEDNCAWLSCDNGFKKDFLEKRYLVRFVQLFSESLGRPIEVKFKVDPQHKSKKSNDTADFGPLFPFEAIHVAEATQDKASLHSAYTFENFIVGHSNNVAYAAAQAIAKNPGATYNPLFIYGGVGVGKTHLMQAIGNTIIKNFPNKKILYFPTEKFTNDFIEALTSKRIKEFREKYRKADVLLADDIQFLGGREGTQEEFFHTFNELHMSGRQIVLSSDRKPQDIAKLEDRLSSRFLGGLAVDIGQPDFEMRVAILKEKAQKRSLHLTDEVCNLIATLVISNTRELEGVLTKIASYAQAQNQIVDQSLVQKVLGHQATKPKTHIASGKELLSCVATYFGLKISDLSGPKRNKQLVLPRQIAMYLLRHELSMPLIKIGQLLGSRDHTTVMYGVDRVEGLLGTSDELNKNLLLIKQQLTYYD
ncbi:chromosomal replication initiator protein DnaA [Candidatus Daviesbacteria bacterium]|nr:chromosomal replication initiator protein DnaA [Candidatus Daviesbacteria bacterium]